MLKVVTQQAWNITWTEILFQRQRHLCSVSSDRSSLRYSAPCFLRFSQGHNRYQRAPMSLGRVNSMGRIFSKYINMEMVINLNQKLAQNVSAQVRIIIWIMLVWTIRNWSKQMMWHFWQKLWSKLFLYLWSYMNLFFFSFEHFFSFYFYIKP